MDFQRNRKYFEAPSFTGPIWMIIIGAILFFVGILLSGGVKVVFIILGLGFIGGGIAIIVTKSNGKVSDQEYDSSVASVLNDMQGRALNRLGVDISEVNEIEPITIDGYRYKGANFAKKGLDNLWRTNKYEYVILFFSQNEVHCYTYRFDTVTPQQSEETDIYFYKDIVSVSTATDTIRLNGQNVDYQYFKLVTAGGTALEVSIRDQNTAQRSINAMRSLLKAKKMG